MFILCKGVYIENEILLETVKVDFTEISDISATLERIRSFPDRVGWGSKVKNNIAYFHPCLKIRDEQGSGRTSARK